MTDSSGTDRFFDAGDECSTKGVVALNAGRTDEAHEWFGKAIDAYEAALDEAPADDVVLVGNLKLCIGARLVGLDRNDEALVFYEEVLDSLAGREDLIATEDGRDLLAQAKLNRAEVRMGDGDLVAATREVEEVLAFAPHHPYAVMLRERIAGL